MIKNDNVINRIITKRNDRKSIIDLRYFIVNLQFIIRNRIVTKRNDKKSIVNLRYFSVNLRFITMIKND